jgi:DNA invertase Pin-like site-specific DNA recombinase
MTAVALYARVSTRDKGQSTENQLPEMRRFAQAHGYTLRITWSRSRAGRTSAPSFKPSFADDYQQRFALVLFWSLAPF